MFLKVKANNDLVEVLSMRDLFDPYVGEICQGRPDFPVR